MKNSSAVQRTQCAGDHEHGGQDGSRCGVTEPDPGLRSGAVRKGRKEPGDTRLQRPCVAEQAGMGIVVWSPLAQGLLTGKHDRGIVQGSRFERLPQFTQGYLAGDNLARGRKLAAIAGDAGLTRAQLALASARARPAGTRAIARATRAQPCR